MHQACLSQDAFQKSELGWPDHGQTRHFGNEIGFFQDVLLKTISYVHNV